MSKKPVSAHTKRDGTQVRAHSRQAAPSAGAVDDGVKQAASVAAQQAASSQMTTRPVSDVVAERLRALEISDEDVDSEWAAARDSYLTHHAALQQQPDPDPGVVVAQLRSMADAMDTMSRTDPRGSLLADMVYANAIAGFEEELQEAEYYEASAP